MEIPGFCTQAYRKRCAMPAAACKWLIRMAFAAASRGGAAVMFVA
jgi:Flp pilus assembly protein TadG